MLPTDPLALDFDLAVMLRGALVEAAAARAASPPGAPPSDLPSRGEGVIDANALTHMVRF